MRAKKMFVSSLHEIRLCTGMLPVTTVSGPIAYWSFFSIIQLPEAVGSCCGCLGNDGCRPIGGGGIYVGADETSCVKPPLGGSVLANTKGYPLDAGGANWKIKD